MRILFFATYYYPYISGITTYPQKIFSFLGKKNRITVLTFCHKKNLKKRETYNNTYIVRIPYWFKISKGFIAPRSLFYFWQYVQQNDLIILNLPNFEGLVLTIIGKIQRKRIVSIFHCQVNLPGNILKKMVNFFLNLSVYCQCLLSDKIIGYTQDYVKNTFFGKKFARKFSYCLPPIEQVNPDQAYLKKLTVWKKKDAWIGFAGRIAQEKGIEYLIQAFEQLHKSQVKLVFAGPYGKDVVGENNYYQKIKKLLNDKQVSYLFLGNLDQKELAAFYKNIDLLVLPSTNSTEAFGMVQAEAMLQGTPVIASDLPGVRIPIKLTQMGIITQPKNTNGIVQAIEKILKYKNQYSSLDLVKKAKIIFDLNKVNQFFLTAIK